MKVLSLALSALVLSSTVNGYSQTLADCKTVAAKFSNTCAGTPDTAASFSGTFAGSTVTCTGITTCPTGGTTSTSGGVTTCTWTRKLCVTCSTSNSKVYMRVQTNSLPAHCFETPNTVNSYNYDTTVLFNPSVTGVTKTSFTS